MITVPVGATTIKESMKMSNLQQVNLLIEYLKVLEQNHDKYKRTPQVCNKIEELLEVHAISYKPSLPSEQADKVYVLVENDHNVMVRGVYSSKDSAEKAVKKINGKSIRPPIHGYDLEEYILDVSTEAEEVKFIKWN